MSAQACSSDTWAAPDPEERKPQAYAVAVANRQRMAYGSKPAAFEVVFQRDADYHRFLAGDIYSAAKDFIEGRFDIHGDLVSAVSFKASNPGTPLHRFRAALMALASSWRLEALFQSRLRARRNIEFHYDRSNEFYGAFLDARMVYSCAYFQTPGLSLEDAQLAKLDLICRKLDVRPNERFLDIGCGWGALLLHAAGRHGALATGCTLSALQVDHALKSAEVHKLADRLKIHKGDFRDVEGSFDKIASVGMFEHVGRKRLHRYFAKVFELLAS